MPRPPRSPLLLLALSLLVPNASCAAAPGGNLRMTLRVGLRIVPTCELQARHLRASCNTPIQPAVIDTALGEPTSPDSLAGLAPPLASGASRATAALFVF